MSHKTKKKHDSFPKYRTEAFKFGTFLNCQSLPRSYFKKTHAIIAQLGTIDISKEVVTCNVKSVYDNILLRGSHRGSG